MESVLKTWSQDGQSSIDDKLKDRQEAYGEPLLELRARKKLESLLDKGESSFFPFSRACPMAVTEYQSASYTAGLLCRDEPFTNDRDARLQR